MTCMLETEGRCSCVECGARRLEFLNGMLDAGTHVLVRVPAEGLRPERMMVLPAGMARACVEAGVGAEVVEGVAS